MAKKKKYSTINQLELIFNDKPDLTNIFIELRKIVSKALSTCQKSRWHIAADISEMTGIEITKAMLDAYTAESKREHRFPAFIIPAFCIAIGNFDLMDYLCEKCGGEFLRGKEVVMAEIVRIEEQMEKLEKDKNRLKALRNELSSKFKDED